MFSRDPEGRSVLLSTHLDPVRASSFDTYTQNEITFVQVEHRTLAVTLYRFVAGEETQVFDLTADEVEQLLQAYRKARPAHKKLLAHSPVYVCAEDDMHPF
jgi:hypothetical protein